MRKVFSTSDQVFHIWAQQNQDEGKAGNVHFDGPTLFSYSTPIAHFMYKEQDLSKAVTLQDMIEKCVLLTTATYSVTTTRHQSDAKRASRQYRQFSVPNIGIGGGRSYNGNYSRDMHTENMQSYIDSYLQNQSKAYASAVHLESYVSQCDRIINEAEAYATFFNVAFDINLFPVFNEEKLAKARGRSERVQVKSDAKRASQEAWRNATVTEQVRMFLAGESSDLPYGWQHSVDAAAMSQVHNKSCDLWRSGATRTLPLFLGAGILLRLKNATTIETSQGAEFPVADAKRAFPHIQSCRDYSSAYQLFPGDRVFSLGSFKIDSISAEGDVKAGCHTVKYSEVELMARTLGLLQNTDQGIDAICDAYDAQQRTMVE